MKTESCFSHDHSHLKIYMGLQGQILTNRWTGVGLHGWVYMGGSAWVSLDG